MPGTSSTRLVSSQCRLRASLLSPKVLGAVNCLPPRRVPPVAASAGAAWSALVLAPSARRSPPRRPGVRPPPPGGIRRACGAGLRRRRCRCRGAGPGGGCGDLRGALGQALVGDAVLRSRRGRVSCSASASPSAGVSFPSAPPGPSSSGAGGPSGASSPSAAAGCSSVPGSRSAGRPGLAVAGSAAARGHVLAADCGRGLGTPGRHGQPATTVGSAGSPARSRCGSPGRPRCRPPAVGSAVGSAAHGFGRLSGAGRPVPRRSAPLPRPAASAAVRPSPPGPPAGRRPSARPCRTLELASASAPGQGEGWVPPGVRRAGDRGRAGRRQRAALGQDDDRRDAALLLLAQLDADAVAVGEAGDDVQAEAQAVVALLVVGALGIEVGEAGVEAGQAISGHPDALVLDGEHDLTALQQPAGDLDGQVGRGERASRSP